MAPDAADSASSAGIGVILHHGGQHGDVVALGSYHCALVDGDLPEAGVRGAQQLLFWEQGGMRGGFHEIPREQLSKLTSLIPNRQEEEFRPEDPSLEYNP